MSAPEPVSPGPRDLRPAPVLDGLRGVAILAVLATHISFLDNGSYRVALRGGFLGVDLFIVLSAFLIASVLLGELGRTATIDERGFARRRARRLYPPLLVMLAVESPVAIAFGEAVGEQVRQVVLALTFTTNWQFSFGHTPPFALLHLWSLAVEAQFYLLMAVGFWLARGRIRSPRVAVLLMLLGSVVVMFWRLWLYQRGTSLEALYERTDTRADSLFLGVAAAIAWRHRLLAPNILKVLGAVSAVVLALSAVFATARAPWLYQGGFTLIAAASALLVAAVTEMSGGLVGRIVGARWLRWVGGLSFSLYLWHLPIYIWVVELAPTAPLPFKVTVALAGSFAVAWLSFRFVESRVLPGWRRTTAHAP